MTAITTVPFPMIGKKKVNNLKNPLEFLKDFLFLVYEQFYPFWNRRENVQ